MTTSVPTKPVHIKGRDIECKRPTETQIAVMAREMKTLRRATTDAGVDIQKALDSVSRFFMIMESVVVSDDDREFLMDQMAIGELELGDFLPVLRAFAPDRDDKPAAPAVRRRATKRR